MNKTCLAVQSGGIGDILWLAGAREYLYKQGYKIIWPVLPQLLYVKDYIKHEHLEFVDINSNWQRDFDLVLDFQTADRHFSGSWQHAKYKLIGLDWSDWSSYLKIERNYQKEQELKDLLQLPKNYAFISKKFGTPPHSITKNFIVGNKTQLPIVNMDFIEGFSLFEWAAIAAEAKEIYSVDSSLFYALEVYNIKAEKLVCYPRSGHTLHIDGLFQNKWIYN